MDQLLLAQTYRLAVGQDVFVPGGGRGHLDEPGLCNVGSS